MATALRPLSTGELLDRTFQLYRAHFILFVGIAALPQLILLAYHLVGAVVARPGLNAFQNVRWILWSFGAIPLGFVALAISQAATVAAVSDVHLGRPAAVWDSYSRVKHRFLGITLLIFVVSLAIGLGLILCIVPGVLLALMWALAVPAAILEDKGVGDALTRSQELSKGSRGRIFVIWLLFFVLQIAVSLLLQWPIIIGAAFLTRSYGYEASQALVQVASAISNFISNSLAAPLATIAFSLVYYDQRVRKEAFDLELMMTTLGGGPSQPAPA
jgi:hypothetical protein